MDSMDTLMNCSTCESQSHAPKQREMWDMSEFMVLHFKRSMQMPDGISVQLCTPVDYSLVWAWTWNPTML